MTYKIANFVLIKLLEKRLSILKENFPVTFILDLLLDLAVHRKLYEYRIFAGTDGGPCLATRSS